MACKLWTLSYILTLWYNQQSVPKAKQLVWCCTQKSNLQILNAPVVLDLFVSAQRSASIKHLILVQYISQSLHTNNHLWRARPLVTIRFYWSYVPPWQLGLLLPFFQHLRGQLIDALSSPVFDSDDDKAQSKAIDEAFPNVKRLTCTRHLKENIQRHLCDTVGCSMADRQRIIQQIFGPKACAMPATLSP